MVVTWSARSPVQLPRAVPNRSKSRAVAPLHYNYHITDGQLLVFYMMLFMFHWLLLSAFQLLLSLILPSLGENKKGIVYEALMNNQSQLIQSGLLRCRKIPFHGKIMGARETHLLVE